ncbi:substrate-binding periplasmic protein [Sneathiella chinensis]|uniref:Solute-binding protein family 3/N-terminal domain-containing protein n=1 Tax=Sneathiella chinensis TaxID=349750 RepID=A0ABQ5TZI2_9PROT|nr:transporter substrate-binding domain-containing protein [Sneathiella chinensis]GLQ04790.1 hypothetical protein GCM10007924_00110 [Sneathiella chinensis]
MTNRLSLLSCLLVLLSLFAIQPTRALETPDTFRICYEDVPQPPFYFGSGPEIPAVRPGLYIHMSDLISERLDLSITHIRAPWKRCLFFLERNEVDAVYGASFKPERILIAHYPRHNGAIDDSRRIATKSYSLYKHKTAPIHWDGEALTHDTRFIGAPLGYSIIPFLEHHGATVETRWSNVEGMNMVAQGRLEAFVAQEPAGDAILGQDPHRFRDVVKVKPPLQSKSYFMIISKGFYEQYPALSETIWDEIALIRDHHMPALMLQYLD